MTKRPETIRAFIAINVPDDLKATIDRLQRQLAAEPGGSGVRWIPRPQVHLTLRFLGDVPVDAVGDIHATLLRAADGRAPFELELGGLGCFPGARQPRILWLGLAGATERLGELHRAMAREAARWGKPEDRPFHPHLTLGRVRPENARSAARLAERLAAWGTPAPGRWPVTQVDLMRSRLLSAGAEYSVLASARLGPGVQLEV